MDAAGIVEFVQHVLSSPAPPRQFQASVPRALVDVCLRCVRPRVDERPATAEDVDGKPGLDAVVTSTLLDAVFFLHGKDSGEFTAGIPYPCGEKPHGLVAEDLNGDGELDIMVANSLNGMVSVLLGDGVGGFGAPVPFVTGLVAYALDIGEFNGDGLPDIAVARDGGSTIGILLSDP